MLPGGQEVWGSRAPTPGMDSARLVLGTPPQEINLLRKGRQSRTKTLHQQPRLSQASPKAALPTCSQGPSPQNLHAPQVYRRCPVDGATGILEGQAGP